MENMTPILKCEQISKVFPGVHALTDVDLVVERGEIHALVGENGAGKSTLMKIILGIHKPTSGKMYFDGKPYAPKGPADALATGISMIHQEISLVPTTTVAENIWIGREYLFGNKVFIDQKKQVEATREILDRLGLQISATAEVAGLSIAEMQLVEIARAVSYNSDVIIMDEPTSALTNAEVDKLYDIISGLAQQGKSVIYISHKLEEVFRTCDAVTVFRDGHFISRRKVADVTKADLIREMVGREMTSIYPKETVEIGAPVLEVKDFCQTGVFKDVNFTVHKGEILGFAGLMGAGRTEIMEALFGIAKKTSGTVELWGEAIEIHHTSDAIRCGMAMVTEDRLRKGALHSLSVLLNTTVASIRKWSKYGFIQKNGEYESAVEICDKLAVKRPSMEADMALLSGGNQQKVIIA